MIFTYIFSRDIQIILFTKVKSSPQFSVLEYLHLHSSLTYENCFRLRLLTLFYYQFIPRFFLNTLKMIFCYSLILKERSRFEKKIFCWSPVASFKCGRIESNKLAFITQGESKTEISFRPWSPSEVFTNELALSSHRRVCFKMLILLHWASHLRTPA